MATSQLPLFASRAGHGSSELATPEISTRTEACRWCGGPRRPGAKTGRFCGPKCRITASKARRAARPLTDREREEFAKERGMELAAARNAEWLGRFREVAEVIAVAGDGTCDIDLVRAWFDAQEIDYPVGNFMGSVFKGDRWVCVGRVPTTHVGGHGREVKRWRLVR